MIGRLLINQLLLLMINRRTGRVAGHLLGGQVRRLLGLLAAAGAGGGTFRACTIVVRLNGRCWRRIIAINNVVIDRLMSVI